LRFGLQQFATAIDAMAEGFVVTILTIILAIVGRVTIA
jgi:hypothetical protein